MQLVLAILPIIPVYVIQIVQERFVKHKLVSQSFKKCKKNLGLRL